MYLKRPINRFIWEPIQADFDKIILYTQNCGVNSLKTDNLFEIWAENKKDYYAAFGNKLIWKSPEPITFNLSADAKIKRVQELIDYIDPYNTKLAQFLGDIRENFFSNVLIDDYYYNDNSVNKKINKGMKITRAFKYFETDARLLDAFQTKASMILQEDKITGYLHLSIHPLDYLTTSENNHKWRSCHALDGEYRAGNLAYMCDTSTVVAYLADENNVSLNCTPEDIVWNSKKWRTLLFFSVGNHSAMFAGRQYPFVAETGLDYIRQAVMETIWKGYVQDWEITPTIWRNDIVDQIEHADKEITHLYTKYIPIEHRLYDINDSNFMQELGDGLFYNDLRYSTIYKKPYYCYLPRVSRDCSFIIGNSVPCLICGKDHLFSSGSMFCRDCEEEYGNCDDPDYFAYCAICGRRVSLDNAYQVDDGDILCEDCAEDSTTVCECCGSRHYNDRIRYDKRAKEYRCEWCYTGEDY